MSNIFDVGNMTKLLIWLWQAAVKLQYENIYKRVETLLGEKKLEKYNKKSYIAITLRSIQNAQKEFKSNNDVSQKTLLFIRTNLTALMKDVKNSSKSTFVSALSTYYSVSLLLSLKNQGDDANEILHPNDLFNWSHIKQYFELKDDKLFEVFAEKFINFVVERNKINSFKSPSEFSSLKKFHLSQLRKFIFCLSSELERIMSPLVLEKLFTLYKDNLCNDKIPFKSILSSSFQKFNTLSEECLLDILNQSSVREKLDNALPVNKGASSSIAKGSSRRSSSGFFKTRTWNASCGVGCKIVIDKISYSSICICSNEDTNSGTLVEYGKHSHTYSFFTHQPHCIGNLRHRRLNNVFWGCKSVDSSANPQVIRISGIDRGSTSSLYASEHNVIPTPYGENSSSSSNGYDDHLHSGFSDKPFWHDKVVNKRNRSIDLTCKLIKENDIVHNKKMKSYDPKTKTIQSTSVKEINNSLNNFPDPKKNFQTTLLHHAINSSDSKAESIQTTVADNSLNIFPDTKNKRRQTTVAHGSNNSQNGSTHFKTKHFKTDVVNDGSNFLVIDADSKTKNIQTTNDNEAYISTDPKTKKSRMTNFRDSNNSRSNSSDTKTKNVQTTIINDANKPHENSSHPKSKICPTNVSDVSNSRKNFLGPEAENFRTKVVQDANKAQENSSSDKSINNTNKISMKISRSTAQPECNDQEENIGNISTEPKASNSPENIPINGSNELLSTLIDSMQEQVTKFQKLSKEGKLDDRRLALLRQVLETDEVPKSSLRDPPDSVSDSDQEIPFNKDACFTSSSNDILSQDIVLNSDGIIDSDNSCDECDVINSSLKSYEIYPPRKSNNICSSSKSGKKISKSDAICSSPKSDKIFSSPRSDVVCSSPKSDKIFSSPRSDVVCSSPKSDKIFSSPRSDVVCSSPKTDKIHSSLRSVDDDCSSSNESISILQEICVTGTSKSNFKNREFNAVEKFMNFKSSPNDSVVVNLNESTDSATNSISDNLNNLESVSQALNVSSGSCSDVVILDNSFTRLHSQQSKLSSQASSKYFTCKVGTEEIKIEDNDRVNCNECLNLDEVTSNHSSQSINSSTTDIFVELNEDISPGLDRVNEGYPDTRDIATRVNDLCLPLDDNEEVASSSIENSDISLNSSGNTQVFYSLPQTSQSNDGILLKPFGNYLYPLFQTSRNYSHVHSTLGKSLKEEHYSNNILCRKDENFNSINIHSASQNAKQISASRMHSQASEKSSLAKPTRDESKSSLGSCSQNIGPPKFFPNSSTYGQQLESSSLCSNSPLPCLFNVENGHCFNDLHNSFDCSCRNVSNGKCSPQKNCIKVKMERIDESDGDSHDSYHSFSEVAHKSTSFISMNLVNSNEPQSQNPCNVRVKLENHVDPTNVNCRDNNQNRNFSTEKCNQSMPCIQIRQPDKNGNTSNEKTVEITKKTVEITKNKSTESEPLTTRTRSKKLRYESDIQESCAKASNNLPQKNTRNRRKYSGIQFTRSSRLRVNRTTKCNCE